MTFPGGVFNSPPINIEDFCCADPLAGGCGHSGSMHTGEGGACRGVFGCSCAAFKRHRATCIHRQAEGGDG